MLELDWNGTATGRSHNTDDISWTANSYLRIMQQLLRLCRYFVVSEDNGYDMLLC